MVLLMILSSLLVTISPLQKVQAATDTVTLTTTVISYIDLAITAGDPTAFGNLTPGTPICAATSTASVTTNAANGYTLGVHDGATTTNSALLHTDTTTRIADMSVGTITTPVVWGANTGVGVGLWDADTSKEAKWGTGITVCDANNKYAAIPETATTAHTVTGFRSGADTSDWSWKIDVPNTQKTGAYSGNVTFTATAVLS